MMLSNTAVNLKIDQIEFGFVDCIKLIKHLKNQPNASFFSTFSTEYELAVPHGFKLLKLKHFVIFSFNNIL